MRSQFQWSDSNNNYSTPKNNTINDPYSFRTSKKSHMLESSKIQSPRSRKGDIIRPATEQSESYDNKSQILSQQQQQQQMRQKKKLVNVEEQFEQIVKEEVDFRDVRYQEYNQMFHEEMNEYSHKVIAIDNQQSSLTSLQNTNSNMLLQKQLQQQIYTQLQSKFYSNRKRDQQDLQDRYERTIKVVRDSHQVDIKNLIAKFKGLLNETLEIKLQEQKQKFDAENREIRDNFYAVKAQIRNLESQVEEGKHRLNDKDEMLESAYEKIRKLNKDLSDKGYSKTDETELLKQQISQFESQKKENSMVIQHLKKDISQLNNIIANKDKEASASQTEINTKSNLIVEKDKVIKILEGQLDKCKQDLLKLQNSNAEQKAAPQKIIVSEVKTQSNNNIIQQQQKPQPQPQQQQSPRPQPQQQQQQQQQQQKVKTVEIIVPQINQEDKTLKKQQQFQKLPLKNVSLPSNSQCFKKHPDFLKEYKKLRKEEMQQAKEYIESLASHIKYKEDQIRLLQQEVMSLKEESDTYQSSMNKYLQNQSKRTSTQFNMSNSKYPSSRVHKSRPSLNDVILESKDYRSHTEFSDDNYKYVQSTFSKNLLSPMIQNITATSATSAATTEEKENNQNGILFNNSNINTMFNNSKRRNLYAVSADKQSAQNRFSLSLIYNSSNNENFNGNSNCNSSTNSTFSQLRKSSNTNSFDLNNNLYSSVFQQKQSDSNAKQQQLYQQQVSNIDTLANSIQTNSSFQTNSNAFQQDIIINNNCCRFNNKLPQQLNYNSNNTNNNIRKSPQSFQISSLLEKNKNRSFSHTGVEIFSTNNDSNDVFNKTFNSNLQEPQSTSNWNAQIRQQNVQYKSRQTSKDKANTNNNFYNKPALDEQYEDFTPLNI